MKTSNGFIQEYLGKEGIISLDVGTIQDGSNSWKPIQSFCDSSVEWLHSLISKVYLEKFSDKGITEPIYYLYNSWREESNDESPVVTYSFDSSGELILEKHGDLIVNKKYRELSRQEESAKNVHATDNLTEVDKSDNKEVNKDEIKVFLNNLILGNPNKDPRTDTDRDLFIQYQGIYTQMAIRAFNKVLKSEAKKIKYVTVVLFRDLDNGKWKLSYNAVVFSNNLDFLNNDSIFLIFDYLSQSNYLNDIKKLKNNLHKESIKSAVSALMARNMSHNLGSHFLTNTKNHFKNFVEIIQSGAMDKTMESKLIAADYRGNVRLLQYIQERMDFLATIVSSDVYPFGGLNFKAEFFDILTNDDCGARHSKGNTDKYEKNFLLQYLLLSEHLTRKYESPLENTENDDFKNVNLQVIYDGKLYTGKKPEKEAEDKELNLRNKLSGLRLAVPGGVMARHALFTIVENILRNAAKHSSVNQEDGLVLTIDVHREKGKYKLSFYDNCNSGSNVVDTIKEKLKNIKILGEDGKIDKNDKGLKEMLICAIWLKNKDLSNCLMKIQNKENNYKAEDYIEVSEKDGNLCYTIVIDAWEVEYHFDTDDNNVTELNISKEVFLNIHADFITADKDYEVSIKREDNNNNKDKTTKKLSAIFPRFLAKKEKDQKLVEVLQGVLDKYNIVIEFPGTIKYLNDIKGVFNRNTNWKTEENEKKENILFFDHLMNSGKKEDWKSDDFRNAAYVDSISGENFTSTLIQPDLLKDPLFRYKVIDSALSKIAIIDERIWGNYRSLIAQDSSSEELLENINRLYNDTNNDNDGYKIFVKKLKELTDPIGLYSQINGKMGLIENFKNLDPAEKKSKYMHCVEALIPKVPKDKIVQLLEKRNIFIYTIDDSGKIKDINDKELPHEEGKYASIPCRFASIHLGILDKLSKSHNIEIDKFIQEIFAYAPRFEDDKHERPFVSIHSGRGNFSPELDNALKDYPFISLSALESALNNSKYLLSELLNNTNYYGKGNLNH